MRTEIAQEKSRTSENATTQTSTGISTMGVTIIGITAGIIGFWAVASMIAGAVNSSGPAELLLNFVKAVTGQPG